jgi:hypothetical protein
MNQLGFVAQSVATSPRTPRSRTSVASLSHLMHATNGSPSWVWPTANDSGLGARVGHGSWPEARTRSARGHATYNNALERTVVRGGPRLAAAQAVWPAAQLGR